MNRNTNIDDGSIREKTSKTHTVSIDVDLSGIEGPINYDDQAIKTALNTGLYTLLEGLKTYLDDQSKSRKKQRKIRKLLRSILDHLHNKKSVKTTQDHINSQIIHLIKNDELAEGKEKWFANLIIYTKGVRHGERLITFVENDFKDKEFDPIKALKEAIKKYNESHKKDSN